MALVESLRRGGYVIYFRHARTDYSLPESREGPEWWRSCDPTVARNLSDEGRAQARAVGEAFRALQIPVGRVLSSEFCRCLETANLAFGQAEATADLSSFATTDDAGRDQRVTALRRLLSTPPPPGTNTVLVGHLFNIQAAAGISLPEGGAAIFEPLGDTGFRLLAVILSEEWTSLAGTGTASGRPASSHAHVATPDREPRRQHNAACASSPRPGSIVAREIPASSQPPSARHERAGGTPGALVATAQQGGARQ